MAGPLFRILIDDREPDEIRRRVTERAAQMGGRGYIVHLPAFDYIVDGTIRIGAERKTGFDLLASLSDGRLQRQAHNMLKDERVGLPVLVITDYLNRKYDKVMVRGQITPYNFVPVQMEILSLMAAGLAVFPVPDHLFSEWLCNAALWAQKKQHLAPRRKHFDVEKLDPRAAVLAGFKGIGEKGAVKILEHYGGLGKALEKIHDWEDVPGIGAKTQAQVEEML